MRETSQQSCKLSFCPWLAHAPLPSPCPGKCMSKGIVNSSCPVFLLLWFFVLFHSFLYHFLYLSLSSVISPLTEFSLSFYLFRVILAASSIFLSFLHLLLSFLRFPLFFLSLASSSIYLCFTCAWCVDLHLLSYSSLTPPAGRSSCRIIAFCSMGKGSMRLPSTSHPKPSPRLLR